MSACGNTGWRVCIRMTVTYFYIGVECILQANDVYRVCPGIQLICITPISLYHHIGTVHFRTLFTSYNNVHIQGISHISSTCSARASEGP